MEEGFIILKKYQNYYVELLHCVKILIKSQYHQLN